MNELFKTHFLNPHNMGKIKKATHYSHCASGFCGDTIDFFAVVDDDNNIIDLKYNAFGCYALIASASILSQWAIGKNVDLVKSTDAETLYNILGNEVDDDKINCVEVVITALKNLNIR